MASGARGARPDLVVLHHTVLDCAACARAAVRPGGRGFGALPDRHPRRDLRAGIRGTPRLARRCRGVGGGQRRQLPFHRHRAGGRAALRFPEPQMRALESLLAEILRRHAMHPARVIGHSDMAPGRKDDPGARFDWRRLARSGLSVWPDAAQGSGCLDAALLRIRLSTRRDARAQARRLPPALPPLRGRDG